MRRKPFLLPATALLATASCLTVGYLWGAYLEVAFTQVPLGLYDHTSPEMLRRGLIQIGASGIVPAVFGGQRVHAANQVSCRQCCVDDWCGCIDTACDCHAELKTQGYTLPLQASDAYAARGKAAWPEALEWRAADIPGWSPIADEQIEVRESRIAGAGRGLFARKSLPRGAVLPPYQGAMLTYSEMENQFLTADAGSLAYIWCPYIRSVASQNTTQSLMPGEEMSGCMDASLIAEQNPPRFVNAAKSSSQCKAVNLEMCELGGVMYFRTLEAVMPDTELITDYGKLYWRNFDGCAKASA